MPVRQVDFAKSRSKKLRRLGTTYQILDAGGNPVRVMNDYLRLQCLAWSANTVRTYAGHLDRFWTWLASNNIDLRDLDDETVAEFAFALAARADLRDSSCLAALGAAQRFIAWSSKELPGALPALQCKSPSALLASVKERRKLIPRATVPMIPRFVPRQNASVFLASLGANPTLGARNQLMGRLMCESGLRVAEVASFPVEALPPLPDISPAMLSSSSPRKMATLVDVVGKGSKHRFVALPWQLHKDLLAYIELERAKIRELHPSRRDPAAVFLSPQGRAVSPSRFREVSSLTGVKVTPHMLRHTYATYEYLETENLPRLKKLLGHALLETSEIYCEFAVLASHSNEYQRLLNSWERWSRLLEQLRPVASEILGVMPPALVQTAMLQSKRHQAWIACAPDAAALNQVLGDLTACGTHAVIGFEIDVFVLDRAP